MPRLVGDLDVAVVAGDQPGGYEEVDQPLVAGLLREQPSRHAVPALVRLRHRSYQAQQQVAQDLSLLGIDPRVHVSADLATAPRIPPEAGYPATVTCAPHAAASLAQGVRHSGSAPAVALDLADEQVDQSGLDQQPGLTGRSLDGGSQVVLVSSRRGGTASLDEPGETRVVAASPSRSARSATTTGPPVPAVEPVEEGRARGVVRTQREDLLALVHHQHRGPGARQRARASAAGRARGDDDDPCPVAGAPPRCRPGRRRLPAA